MDGVHVTLLDNSMIPSIVTLVNDAYLFEATFKKDPTRITIDELQRMKDSGSGRHFVLTIPSDHRFYTEYTSVPSDGIIGHIYVEYRATYGYFGLLAVHTSLHGAGLGSFLLKYAEESMIKEGLKQSGCSVVSPIPRLQAYYERRGYKATGETEPWNSDNLKCEAWFIYMRKDL